MAKTDKFNKTNFNTLPSVTRTMVRASLGQMAVSRRSKEKFTEALVGQRVMARLSGGAKPVEIKVA